MRLGSRARRSPPFNLERLHQLDEWLDRVEAGIAAGETTALVIRLGGPPAMPSDLDIEEVQSLPDAEAARVWAGEGQRILQRIEQLSVPTVAAISGRCTWSGLQIALACRHRLALGSSTTRLGLPEARLGILPAWGGTVRLLRRLGLQSALDLLLRSDTVSAGRARSIGLVDEVFARAEFRQRARAFTLERVRRGSGRLVDPRRITTRVVEDTAPGRRLVLSRAARRARRQTRVAAPVLDKLIQTAADILALPPEAGFAAEAERFAALLEEDVARALIHSWRVLHPGPESAAPEDVRPVAHTAVIGAGSRGVALAQRLASRGLTVRLKDVRRETVARAERRLRDQFAREVEEKRLDERDMERVVQRVSGTTGFGGFGRIDVVLEAVAENAQTKQRALREVEEHVRDSCVLLTTSPLIAVAEAQHGLARPEQVAGLHLFRSGQGKGVAEVVRGERTGDAAVRAAGALARRLRYARIVVADAPGLLAYRLAVPYLLEAQQLWSEGFTAEQIDGAMLRFGIAPGPFGLLQEIGSDTLERVAVGLAARYGDRFSPPIRLHDAGRRSRVAGIARRMLAAIPSVRSPRPAGGGVAASAAIEQRLLLVLINEAARMLDERVVPTAAEIDRVSILALGFPVERGGLLFHADRLGAAAAVERLHGLAERQGMRFAPCPLLLRLAREGGGFGALVRVPSSPAPAADRGAAGQMPADMLT